MTERIREWRTQLDRFLNREAKVRDLLKATIPLWLCLAVGMIVAIAALVAQANAREADQLRSRIDSCQLRNSAQEAARRDNVNIIATLELNFPGVPEIIAALRESQSTAAGIDTDCDDDGWLTQADYTEDVYPPYLPVKKVPS